MSNLPTEAGAEAIAIIGMALRVPGSADAVAFWRNLVDGVEAMTHITREENLARGVPVEEVDDDEFVSVSAIIDDMEYFDAELFGLSAREADLMDPQLRIFLEQAHAALLDAGYDSTRYQGEIGVYAGSGAPDYAWLNIRANPRAYAGAGPLSLAVGNNVDYVATTASYRLNLRGPSMTIKTACSSSLVAVHVACEALRGGECDMALAGGVNIELPYGTGYRHSPGFLSSSGHCKPFDADGDGTIWGSGVGVVMLKRLSDALADKDTIHAVILGNAINNDGAGKVGFSAPSVEGQMDVVRQALDMAGVDPRTIGYVEAHGTGTALGDPIEVNALSAVYVEKTADRGWCGIGSVKSNLGHLSQASGVVGLIKATLAVRNGVIPPTINYKSPNPRLELETSPFYIASTVSKWDSGGGQRRAAVSSFGIGGTNAHVVLGEAPPSAAASHGAPSRARLIQVSARTPQALTASANRLAEHLTGCQDELADVAYTLRAGRAGYEHRAAVVAADLTDAVAALRDQKRLMVGQSPSAEPAVALLFSGQGAQYAGMGAQLYRTEPVFARAIDECAELLRPHLADEFVGELARDCGLDLRGDLRAALFPAEELRASADALLSKTALTQPALFTVEYALAMLWRSWGLRPVAMIGHSIGEYVAATLAGVFRLPDALRLVAYRGRLMQSMPAGAMLAVQALEEQVRALLPDQLSVATINGPSMCVVAGPSEVVTEFAATLKRSKLASTPLRTSHAFHSAMMAPIVDDFAAIVAAVPRQAPTGRFLSNVTGEWIADSQAVDPAYWAAHLRQAVRFADCLATLHRDVSGVRLLECGPGRQLAGLARSQVPKGAPVPLYSIGVPTDKVGELETIYATAGRLWVDGSPIDIDLGSPPARRVSLPGYPYERARHWITPDPTATKPTAAKRRRVDDWFEAPIWRQLTPTEPTVALRSCVLFVADSRGEQLATALADRGRDVFVVRSGPEFASVDGGCQMDPLQRGDFDRLVAELVRQGRLPGRVVYAWPLRGADSASGELEASFYSLLWLTQALAAAQVGEGVRLDVLTAGAVTVDGGEAAAPIQATVAGVVQVAPLEIPGLTAIQIDLERSQASLTPAGLASLLSQLERSIEAPLVALRRGKRWMRDFEPALAWADASPLRVGGRYLITGGLGGIGITLAEGLAKRYQARLALLSRTQLPPREQWDEHLAVHGPTHRVGRAIAAIRRIEAAGGTVLLVGADTTDVVGLRRVRDEITAAFGGLDAILHSAGVAGGGMIEVKQEAVAAAVLAPKVAGTLALAEAFGDVAMDFVALFSSVTGISGDFGQVDYCAANAFLDAYANSTKDFAARVIAVNWGGWAEVGMAAETAAPDAFRALQRGTSVTKVDHPILTELSTGDVIEVSGRVSPATHWVLDEHRIGTAAVLPGTAHLESVRAAVQAAAAAGAISGGDGQGSTVVELCDVAFLEPLNVADGGAAAVTVRLQPGAEGVDFEVLSTSGGQVRSHVRGSAALVARPSTPSLDLSAIIGRCALAGDASGPGRSSMLNFGPRWSCLQQTYVGDGEELAIVEATDQVRAELDRWILHPALLDVATAFGRSRGSGSYLPLGYGRLLVHDALPARFYSYLRYRDAANDEVVAADLTLTDEAGRPLVSIGEFLLRRVDSGSVLGTLASDAGAAAPMTTSGLVSANSANAIAPEEGVEALCRLLATPDLGAQVVVSAISIHQIMDRTVTTETVEEAVGSGTAVAITHGVHTAPRTPLEATIANVWASVLGVEQVGADSDFFELGGNSLVAVQLISKMRIATGVRLPMRALFEASTVAAIAQRVEQVKAEESSGGDAPDDDTIPRLARP